MSAARRGKAGMVGSRRTAFRSAPWLAMLAAAAAIAGCTATEMRVSSRVETTMVVRVK